LNIAHNTSDIRTACKADILHFSPIASQDSDILAMHREAKSLRRGFESTCNATNSVHHRFIKALRQRKPAGHSRLSNIAFVLPECRHSDFIYPTVHTSLHLPNRDGNHIHIVTTKKNHSTEQNSKKEQREEIDQ
jgi:hypothetical protein